MRPRLRIAVTIGLALILVGCSNQTGPTGQDAAKFYDIKGKVVSVEAEKKTIELDHEEIPGLMKAMKMEYNVADQKLIEGLKAGDTIQGKFKVESGKYTITSLEKR